METGISLNFRGTGNVSLLAVLMGAVALVVIAWGLAHLFRGRRRYGLLCLAGGLGPAGLVPALVVDAAVGVAAGDRRRARRAVLAAAAMSGVTLGALAAVPVAAPGAEGLATVAALILSGLLGAMGLFYASVYAWLGTGRMAALMVLRGLAVLALVAILFKPALVLPRSVDARRPYLAVVVDRSGSMATFDEPSTPSRYQRAMQMLLAQQRRIEGMFRPAWYHFAEAFRTAGSLRSLSGLTPAGPGTEGTDIASALRDAAGDFRPDELAGVVLLTDGRDNVSTGHAVRQAAAESPVPVYPVAVGSDRQGPVGRRNLAIEAVDAPLEALVDNVTTIRATVGITGYPGRFFRLRLLDAADGRQLASTEVSTPASAGRVEAELSWTPAPPRGEGSKSGVRALELELDADPGEGEVADNVSPLHVLLAQPRLRVLYVEGSMRPEYRALRRTLMTDRNVELLGLVRTSGNRFWAQGSLDGQTLHGLPGSEEDFARFDVLILGDLDKTFLEAGDAGRMDRIARWVREGGGLLMLGGGNSFGPGGYGGTAIEDVLPVRTGTRRAEQELTPLVPELTAEGLEHPVLRGVTRFLPGPGDRRPASDAPTLPELRGCVTVPRAKPAAKVLLVHPSRRNEQGPLTVLAVQPFVGEGRSAALTADTTYLWDRPMRARGLETPYAAFWGQLVRWLAGVESRAGRASPSLVLRPSRTHLRLGEQARLLVRLAGVEDRPEAARVVCEVVPAGDPDARASEVELRRTAPGLYAADWSPERSGVHRLRARAVEVDGERIAEDEIAVTVAERSPESQAVALDAELLRSLAEASGGRYVRLEALPELIDRLAETAGGAGVGEPTRRVRLYHFPALLGALIVLLTAEWILRRRWQLQ